MYKLNGGTDAFIYYFLDVCTHLLNNSPRLERIGRPAIDNIARLTGRNPLAWETRNSNRMEGIKVQSEAVVEFAMLEV